VWGVRSAVTFCKGMLQQNTSVFLQRYMAKYVHKQSEYVFFALLLR